jgi:L-ascorbate metabolism protein UlaG (beta-lactamase superfamily)
MSSPFDHILCKIAAGKPMEIRCSVTGMRHIIPAALLSSSLALTLPVAGQAPSGFNKEERSSKVTLTYLGTAGWVVSDGRVTIVIDPYVSRLRFAELFGSALPATPGDERRIYQADDPLMPDTAAIDRLIPKADYILVHHSHFDHVLDVPYLAKERKAIVIGHESTTNIARADGVPDSQLITVRGGEDYEFGSFSLRVIPGLHSPLDKKHYYDSRIAPRDIRLPLNLEGYPEGGSLAYLIRIAGHEILTFGSMNYVEHELEGLRPDVVLVGWNKSQSEIHDYLGRLMRVLGNPRTVLPTHWDDLWLAYDMPQTTALERLKAFQAGIANVSPATQVVIPHYFEPIELPVETTPRRRSD